MSFAYTFDHTHDRAPRELRGLLGGKGANLAEMTTVLQLPVPPGFTLTTQVCTAFYENERQYPEALAGQVDAAIAKIE